MGNQPSLAAAASPPPPPGPEGPLLAALLALDMVNNQARRGGTPFDTNSGASLFRPPSLFPDFLDPFKK